MLLSDSRLLLLSRLTSAPVCVKQANQYTPLTLLELVPPEYRTQVRWGDGGGGLQNAATNDPECLF